MPDDMYSAVAATDVSLTSAITAGYCVAEPQCMQATSMQHYDSQAGSVVCTAAAAAAPCVCCSPYHELLLTTANRAARQLHNKQGDSAENSARCLLNTSAASATGSNLDHTHQHHNKQNPTPQTRHLIGSAGWLLTLCAGHDPRLLQLQGPLLRGPLLPWPDLLPSAECF